MVGVVDDSADHVRIELPKVLLVEGASECRFFEKLLGELDISKTIQVISYHGKHRLKGFLHTLPVRPEYSLVDSLGVTRDADESSASAFQSVCDLLKNAGLDAPAELATTTQGRPRVSIFILPDCASPGMLETLCLSAIQDDPAMPCVEQFLQCLEETADVPSRNSDKARAHAFLASRTRPELRVGEAAEAGCWQLDSPVYDQLKDFLQAL